MANMLRNVIEPEVRTYRLIKPFNAVNDGEIVFDLKAGDTVTGQIIDQGIYGTPLQRGIQVRKPNGVAIPVIIPIGYVDINNPQSETNWYLYGGIAVAAIVGIYLITRKK